VRCLARRVGAGEHTRWVDLRTPNEQAATFGMMSVTHHAARVSASQVGPKTFLRSDLYVATPEKH
jgi:hypothetical protein